MTTETATTPRVVVAGTLPAAGLDPLRIHARALAAIKRGAVLVNATRGAVVDRRRSSARSVPAALPAARLDVYEDEPRVPAELRALPNTVLLAHVRSATRTRDPMQRLCAENVMLRPRDASPRPPWSRSAR